MRPFVPDIAELKDQGPLGPAEGVAKYFVPGIRHQLEQSGHVPFGDGLFCQHAIFSGEASGDLDGLCLIFAFELALDERREPGSEQFHCFAYALLVGNGHGLLLGFLK